MKKENLTKLTLNLNVVILGAIAKAYAAGSTAAPQRQWGSEISSRSILWNGDLYSIARYREGKFVGLRMTVTKDAMNGGTEQENYLFPYDSFDSLVVSVEGVRLEP